MTNIIPGTDTTLNALVTWGAAQPDICAMLLTSTRAVVGANVDRFSDYDVILIATDVPARYHDRAWLVSFGEVVIEYWDPLERSDTLSGQPTSNGIVYYPGTLKIDFTLWPIQEVAAVATLDRLPPELDAGYQVLLDKDDLCRNWPGATGWGYRRSLPTAAEYDTLVNDFFIGVPYVVTALIRGEILPAKWVLDYDMRYVYLLPMLEWYAVINGGAHPHGLHSSAEPGVGNRRALDAGARARYENDQPTIGVHGKGIQHHLPGHIWAQLENTYTDMDPTANRAALDRMIGLFREVAIAVGDVLGYAYPQALQDRVLAHIDALEGTS